MPCNDSATSRTATTTMRPGEAATFPVLRGNVSTKSAELHKHLLAVNAPKLTHATDGGSKAGSDLPRVSAAKGISSRPSAKAIEVSATGIPSEPKCRTPAPTRNVIPAPPKRAKDVENANALARHSVGYCSGSHRV